MTSGQEMERVHSYNPGARTGSDASTPNPGPNYYVDNTETSFGTSEKRLMKRFPWRRMMLNARQQRSTNFWNCSPGLSPPLITYAMSDVSTNGVRSLPNNRTRLPLDDWSDMEKCRNRSQNVGNGRSQVPDILTAVTFQ